MRLKRRFLYSVSCLFRHLFLLSCIPMRQKIQIGSKVAIILAVGTLIASLAFAAVRLLQVEHNLRKGEIYTQLWNVSQAQYATILLTNGLAQIAAEGRAEETKQEGKLEAGQPVAVRLDDAIAAMTALLDERQALSISDKAGSIEELRKVYEALTQAQPLVRNGLDPDQAARLEEEARKAVDVLQAMAAKVMVVTREREDLERTVYLRLVFEILASMVGVFAGSAILFFGLFSGIRQTTQTQRLLRQERELSDLVINNISNQGIVIFDHDLRCMLWNPGMEALLGIKAVRAVGMNLRQVLPFFSKADAIDTLTRAINGMGSAFEDESLSPDGADRCLEANCFPLNIAERRLGIAFIRDITESWQARRQAQEQNVHLEIQVQQRTAALQQAERRLIEAIETAPEGFAAFDAAGQLLFANERIRNAEPVMIWCRTDMTLDVFLRCFALCEGADERLLRAEPSFEEVSLDLLIKKDVWAHLSVTKAYGGTIFVRLTDISGYKQASRALQSALERERETTLAYRSFVTMVSHQFRTPLAILDSSAQRLIRRGENLTHDELSNRVQRMRGATSRLTRLVESVLNAAKLDAGRMEINPVPCDLVDLVWDICERQKELSPYAQIRFDAPDKPVRTSCDSILVEQVVINLLSNAVKYSGESPVVDVAIWMEGDRAYCSVRDMGIGIPSDEISRIFDRFYRARTAYGIAGTGIGLNFAQKIIQLHGGMIHVQSHEAVGSVFTFDLPLEGAEEEPKAA